MQLYLKSQEKEREAEAQTTTQNRNLYGSYMQEIDPYGEFAEKIARKGLSKSGYPQYSYEGFKKAFEAQTGDNMQNLRQLKAELQAALKLAIDTQNEKLEETLLDYQEKIAKLEKEYAGKETNQNNISLLPEMIRRNTSLSPMIVKDIEAAADDTITEAQTLPNNDILSWYEWINTLRGILTEDEITNMFLRESADNSALELQNFSAPISRTANAEAKLNNETDVVELFESMGYVVEEVQHGKSRMKALQIKNENGKIVLKLYPYSDIREQNGKYVLSENSLNIKTILDLIQDNPKSRVKERVLDYAERILRADGDITQADLDYLAANIGLLEGDTEVETALDELFNDEEFAAAWEERINTLESQENHKGDTTLGEASLMVASVISTLLLGYSIPTKNEQFNNAMKFLSFAVLITPMGFVRGLLTKSIGKKALEFALRKISIFISQPKAIERIRVVLETTGKLEEMRQATKTVLYGLNSIGIHINDDIIDFINKI